MERGKGDNKRAEERREKGDKEKRKKNRRMEEQNRGEEVRMRMRMRTRRTTTPPDLPRQDLSLSLSLAFSLSLSLHGQSAYFGEIGIVEKNQHYLIAHPNQWSPIPHLRDPSLFLCSLHFPFKVHLYFLVFEASHSHAQGAFILKKPSASIKLFALFSKHQYWTKGATKRFVVYLLEWS